MKKIVLILAGLCSLSVFSQESQLTKLSAIDSSTIYHIYRVYEKEGKLHGSKSETKYQVKKENNMHNKLSTFYFAKEGTDNKDVNMGFGWLLPNHYTTPSVFYSSRHKRGYVFINEVCYGLKIADINTPESFVIEYIFSPLKKKVEKKEEANSSKKMTMKERMAAAKEKIKEAVAEGEGGLPKSLSEVNHKAIVKDYLIKMKQVQTKATANFSSSIKAEIKAIEQAKKDKSAKIKETNDAYWKSPAGQEILRRRQQNSGSSSSSSSTSSAKMVSVQISSGTRAKNYIFVHWTENGTKKSKTVPARSSTIIGKIPAGTKIYYSVDDVAGPKSYLGQVPTDKDNIHLTVK